MLSKKGNEQLMTKSILGKLQTRQNVQNVRPIDYSNGFEDIDKKINKLQKPLETGVMDTDILRNLLAMLLLIYHGMIYIVRTKKSTS